MEMLDGYRPYPFSLLPPLHPLPGPREPRGGGAVLPAGPARLFTPSHYGGARLQICSFTFIYFYLRFSPLSQACSFIHIFSLSTFFSSSVCVVEAFPFVAVLFHFSCLLFPFCSILSLLSAHPSSSFLSISSHSIVFHPIPYFPFFPSHSKLFLSITHRFF